MTIDDVIYSPKEYSPIYVSKLDFSTIEKLSHELNNDTRYSKRVTSGITVRERFASKIICIDWIAMIMYATLDLCLCGIINL